MARHKIVTHRCYYPMMQKHLPTIEETIDFIKLAHWGQIDKAGKPYHEHPIAVMGRLPEDSPLEWKLAALLHDVIEDTGHTRATLSAAGFSDDVLDIVDLVTITDKLIPYPTKIRSIIDSGNEGAIRVKFADMTENTSPSRMNHLPEDEQLELRQKYAFPYQMLKKAVAELDAVKNPLEQSVNAR